MNICCALNVNSYLRIRHYKKLIQDSVIVCLWLCDWGVVFVERGASM